MPLPARSLRRTLLALVAAATSLVLAFHPAPAAAAPAVGQTQLTFDDVLQLGMKTVGVKVSPIAPATIGSGGLYLPVGRQNATSALVGTVRHQGGFQLAYRNMRVGFRNLTFATRAGKTVAGTLTGEPVINGFVIPIALTLSRVTVSSASVTRGTLVAHTKIRLDPMVVSLVNSLLKVPVLSTSMAWATTETRLPAPTK